MDIATYRNAMARMGGAVSIITTDGAAGRAGFTASAVCSVTDTPPTLLVCMNRQSRQHESFQANGVLCVNVLGGEHQGLGAAFADRTLDMPSRFDHTQWRTAKTGAPIMDLALVSFECSIVQAHEVGTHTIFYCSVQGIHNGRQEQGLIYFDRAYHRVGGVPASTGAAVA